MANNSGQEIDEDKRHLMTVKEAESLMQKKTLPTTFNSYLYETLFKSQEDSDVSIVIFGRTWKLHKCIIKQSPYFAKMFSGSWKENAQEVTVIEIADKHITEDAVEMVLSSLYSGEINLGPKNVVSIVATAAHFLLDEMAQKCATLMKLTMNETTVMPYYEAAELYGLTDVLSDAKKWLEVNLILSEYCNCRILKQISPRMMNEILNSPNLIVDEEFEIYKMLKNWLYAQLISSQDEEPNLKVIEEFFLSQSWTIPSTEEGSMYKNVFQCLRMQNIFVVRWIDDSNSYDAIKKTLNVDNIVSAQVLEAACLLDYDSMMRIAHSLENGPTGEQVSETTFEKYCWRICFSEVWEDENGDIHNESATICLGLISVQFFSENGMLYLQRTGDKENDRKIIFSGEEYNIMMKVSVISLNNQCQVKYKNTSGLLSFRLNKTDKVRLLELGSDLTCPFMLSVKGLDVTPCEVREANSVKLI